MSLPNVPLILEPDELELNLDDENLLVVDLCDQSTFASIPKRRAASRWLSPSIITAWRTRAYSSTRFIPRPSLQYAKGYR